MAVECYDLKHRQKVAVPEKKVNRVTFTTKNGQVRYGLRAATEDGRTLTKFVSRSDWERANYPIEGKTLVAEGKTVRRYKRQQNGQLATLETGFVPLSSAVTQTVAQDETLEDAYLDGLSLMYSLVVPFSKDPAPSELSPDEVDEKFEEVIAAVSDQRAILDNLTSNMQTAKQLYHLSPRAEAKERFANGLLANYNRLLRQLKC